MVSRIRWSGGVIGIPHIEETLSSVSTAAAPNISAQPPCFTASTNAA
jgi:hypothetical protein